MSDDLSASLERDLVFAVAEGLDANVERWLRFVGWTEGQWLELQALGVPGAYTDRVRFAHTESVAGAVSLLGEMENVGATGVYTIANRINPAVATRATPERWHDAKQRDSTSERDITHRRVVFVDIDVKRPSGTSATDDELARAIPVARAIYARLAALLGTDALGYGHSGNGRQVFVALDELPETPELATLVRDLLGALAREFTTEHTTVDVGVCDAKRLVPAFGTTKRKGARGIAARPHRLTGFVCAPAVQRATRVALEAVLAAFAGAPTRSAPAPPAAARAKPPAKSGGSTRAGGGFDEANSVPIASVVDALGLAEGGVVTCPGCRNTSGVSLVGNGLKCHHQSCAAKGVPGHPGFRTVVDVVAEAQSLSPHEAVAWIRERFGSPNADDDIEGAPERDPDEGPLPAGMEGRRFPLTDVGNAERFAAHHGVDIRHCHEWKKWLVWDEARWSVDRRGEVDLRAIQTVRAIKAEARHIMKKNAAKAVFGHAKDSEKASALSAMVRVARALPGVPIVPEQLDRDALLFNCTNGTLDLRTGELGPHRREDHMTKLSPVAYDPCARAPLWERFLLEIMGGDTELVAFLQRAVGYSMTGCVNEQVLFFLHGAGANGKSTFLRALLEIFGDYGKQSAPDILVAKRNDSHPTEIADLFGARLVVCQEMDAGRALAEATIKKLTGGDLIKARLMGENFWTFAPTHKFFLAANHKPKVNGTDEAIWRRLKLIPFTVTIPEGKRDGQLLEKLLAERAGILRWAAIGCARWRESGLRAPAKVVEATKEYRKEEDRIAAFLEECCEVAPAWSAPSAILYRGYLQWCDQNAARAVGRRSFGEQLQAHQFAPDKGTNGVRQWTGLRLKAEHAPSFERGDGRGSDVHTRDDDVDGFRWSDA